MMGAAAFDTAYIDSEFPGPEPVDGEAETAPAPALAIVPAALGEEEMRLLPSVAPSVAPSSRPSVAPSSRPTSVPTFDLEALARTCLPPEGMQLDRLVPVRTAKTVAKGVDLRSIFLLLHVDDRSNVAQIAHTAELPLAEVVSCFFELLALGVVDMAGEPAMDLPRASGVYARVLPAARKASARR